MSADGAARRPYHLPIVLSVPALREARCAPIRRSTSTILQTRHRSPESQLSKSDLRREKQFRRRSNAAQYRAQVDDSRRLRTFQSIRKKAPNDPTDKIESLVEPQFPAALRRSP